MGSKIIDAEDPATSLAGTPYFSSPEMRGIIKDGERSAMTEAIDIYSLGRLIFVMFYGCDVFRIESTGRGDVLKSAQAQHWFEQPERCVWRSACTRKPEILPNKEKLTIMS